MKQSSNCNQSAPVVAGDVSIISSSQLSKKQHPKTTKTLAAHEKEFLHFNETSSLGASTLQTASMGSATSKEQDAPPPHSRALEHTPFRTMAAHVSNPAIDNEYDDDETPQYHHHHLDSLSSATHAVAQDSIRQAARAEDTARQMAELVQTWYSPVPPPLYSQSNVLGDASTSWKSPLVRKSNISLNSALLDDCKDNDADALSCQDSNCLSHARDVAGPLDIDSTMDNVEEIKPSALFSPSTDDMLVHFDSCIAKLFHETNEADCMRRRVVERVDGKEHVQHDQVDDMCGGCGSGSVHGSACASSSSSDDGNIPCNDHRRVKARLGTCYTLDEVLGNVEDAHDVAVAAATTTSLSSFYEAAPPSQSYSIKHDDASVTSWEQPPISDQQLLLQSRILQRRRRPRSPRRGGGGASGTDEQRAANATLNVDESLFRSTSVAMERDDTQEIYRLRYQLAGMQVIAAVLSVVVLLLAWQVVTVPYQMHRSEAARHLEVLSLLAKGAPPSPTVPSAMELPMVDSCGVRSSREEGTIRAASNVDVERMLREIHQRIIQDQPLAIVDSTTATADSHRDDCLAASDKSTVGGH